jgi:hypothetical protein
MKQEKFHFSQAHPGDDDGTSSEEDAREAASPPRRGRHQVKSERAQPLSPKAGSSASSYVNSSVIALMKAKAFHKVEMPTRPLKFDTRTAAPYGPKCSEFPKLLVHTQHLQDKFGLTDLPNATKVNILVNTCEGPVFKVLKRLANYLKGHGFKCLQEVDVDDIITGLLAAANVATSISTNRRALKALRCKTGGDISEFAENFADMADQANITDQEELVEIFCQALPPNMQRVVEALPQDSSVNDMLEVLRTWSVRQSYMTSSVSPPARSYHAQPPVQPHLYVHQFGPGQNNLSNYRTPLNPQGYYPQASSYQPRRDNSYNRGRGGYQGNRGRRPMRSQHQ